MTHDRLLGDDCLRILQAMIDYYKAYVYLGGQWLPSCPSRLEDIGIAMTDLEEWVMLRPNVFTVDGIRPQKRRSPEVIEAKKAKAERKLGPSLRGKRIAESPENQETKRQCLVLAALLCS